MSNPTPTQEAAWTIGRLLTWTTDYLARNRVDEPRLCSEVLLAHACHCRRIDLYARFDQPIEPEALDNFRLLIKRAAAQEPIAYLVGEREFFSLPFVVTPAVLIPRPETETLVEVAIDHCSRAGLVEPRILEIGTGSGCIAVALAKNVAGATIVATDISSEAIGVARQNAQRHAVQDRVCLMEADRFALPAEIVANDGFDLLVSNPPYVALDGMAGLAPMVRDFEPRVALTDEGDGLSFYRDIAENAGRVLKPDGRIIVEVGDGQAELVLAEVEKIGALRHERTVRDRVVRRDRVLVFSLDSSVGSAPVHHGG